jgi:hypothetical protein
MSQCANPECGNESAGCESCSKEFCPGCEGFTVESNVYRGEVFHWCADCEAPIRVRVEAIEEEKEERRRDFVAAVAAGVSL